MMVHMRRWIISLATAAMVLAMSPIMAMAQQQQPTDPSKIYDGRLEGFGRPMTLDAGGSALIWMLFVGLGVIGLGVLFKNAQRSHLD